LPARSTADSGIERISQLGVSSRRQSLRAPRDTPTRSSAGGTTMIDKTVTRADLSAAVYGKVSLSRSESSALVELVLKEITDTLEKGETVKLSSFGSFTVRTKGQRIGRNPKTGTSALISPRRVVVFKSSAILKQRMNEQRSHAKTPLVELGSPATDALRPISTDVQLRG
jgi:integration host factor subunit alpha